MARVKGGIKKRIKEEEELTFDQKRIAEFSKSLIKKADLKGAISEKEMEFFTKLITKKKK